MVKMISLEGYKGLKYGEDGNLYRLPFKSKGRSYGLRKIKKQKGNRWRIRFKEKEFLSQLEIDGILLMSTKRNKNCY